MLTIDLAGRVALVTGGSGQLGRVICRRLAEAGAAVAVHYHRGAERAAAVVEELSANGTRAVAVPADLADAAAVAALHQRIEAELGPVGIVVANAVQQYAWTSVLEQPLEDFQSQFDSCVRQVVLLAKTFAPSMLAAGGGRLIAISTECAAQCHPTQGAYVAGKRGMDGVLRVLARELGPGGVTVNQVAPGWMISERDRSEGTTQRPQYEQSVPLRRRGEDGDIADAVAFLASDRAGFITGAWLPVCGGNVMAGI
jgi:3-oxoacyl-[acyl-carrier protein] reductase